MTTNDGRRLSARIPAATAVLGLLAAACAPGAEDPGSRDATDARHDDGEEPVLDGNDGGPCDPAACTAACSAAGFPGGTCDAAGACSCSGGADAGDWSGDACASENVTAEHAVAPVDIIWVVDSSGSMDYENHAVRDNLNSFSLSISASGIDHHVVLIGDRGEMDVPPPLGGSPDFLHIDDSVDSNAALQKILEHYATYRGHLRAGAVQHFVAVTDDESDLSADGFMAALAALTDPGFPPGWRFHSIVAQGAIPFIGCITGARIGARYLELTARTGGVSASVCETDWSPIFAALEEAIGVVTELPCVYAIPEPPAGMELDYNLVNLDYTPDGGSPTTIPRVADPGACPAMGWTFDDPTAPTQIVLCPETCDILHADPGGSVAVAFGCATVMI